MHCIMFIPGINYISTTKDHSYFTLSMVFGTTYFGQNCVISLRANLIIAVVFVRIERRFTETVL